MNKPKYWFIISAIIIIVLGLGVVYIRPSIQSAEVSNNANWVPFILALPFFLMGLIKMRPNDARWKQVIFAVSMTIGIVVGLFVLTWVIIGIGLNSTNLF